MREKGQTEVAKTLETPVFSRGIEILTEKIKLVESHANFAVIIVSFICSLKEFVVRTQFIVVRKTST